jgi:hypothetical protein
MEDESIVRESGTPWALAARAIAEINWTADLTLRLPAAYLILGPILASTCQTMLANPGDPHTLRPFSRQKNQRAEALFLCAPLFAGVFD